MRCQATCTAEDEGLVADAGAWRSGTQWRSQLDPWRSLVSEAARVDPPEQRLRLSANLGFGLPRRFVKEGESCALSSQTI